METKDILKNLRKSRGFNNAKDFCEASGISYNTYQNYEAGKRMPPAETLLILADFYGVSTDYLLGRELAPPAFLAQEGTELEWRLLEQYFKLPEPYRKKFLEGVIQAVEMQKQENFTDTAQEDLGPLTQSATIGELLAASDDEAKNGA